MHSLIVALVAVAEPVNNKKDLYPKAEELIVGAIAFAVLFAFMWKWVIPRLNQTLEARRQKIQGDLERAERAREEAERQLSDYREQLAGARDEANRIVEEARRAADVLRADLLLKAEQESRGVVTRAQEEIRAERDRVFQELKGRVGELSLELAERVVREELADRERQRRLVDQYLREISSLAPSGNGGPAGGTSREGGS